MSPGFAFRQVNGYKNCISGDGKPMKRGTNWVVFLLAALCTSQIAAQSSGRERIERLKQELAEVQAKQGELRVRLEQLNEAVKPENIERSLAGIGSTKPEELREHRRRTLTIERDGVLAQLNKLEERRLSLESAIAVAENQAYLQSAQPPPSTSPQMFVAGNVERSPWLWAALAAGVSLFVIIGAGAYVIARRRSAT